jgi:aminopeptidase N
MRPAPLAICAILLLAGCTPTHPGAAPRAVASVPPAVAPVDYAAWAAGRSTPVADPIYPKHGTAALDVLHYDLALDWAPATKSLTGTATLRIRPTADAASLTLDFKPYRLDSVTVDDAAVTGTVAAEKLTVPVAVTRDKPVTLVVKYHGKPSTTRLPSRRTDFKEGLGLRATKNGGAWTMQEPYGAYTWYPANDQPSDKALYDITVTVP